MPETAASSGSMPPAGQDHFLSTRWSVVLAAGGNDTTQSQQALSVLCQTYWYPLYAFVRRKGFDPHDAQDMTQEFFARLLEYRWLEAVSRDKGRFRAFLLAALNHFLANEWDRRKAQKRGGGEPVLSLDAQAAETSYQREPSDNVSAETIYERRWALTLLDLVMRRLEAEYATDGKADLFVKLKFAITGERSAVPYASLAAEIGLSESAIKVAVHRLRQRYRELLRAEITQTVASPGEIDGELRYLIKVISR